MRARGPRSSDLDERLALELKHVRTPALREDPRELDRLHEIAFTKARKRVLLRGSSAVVIAGLLFLAVSFPRFVPAVAPGPVGTAVAAQFAPVEEPALGFWPAVDEATSRRACAKQDLSFPELVAQRFAVEVLGWDRATVSRPDHDGGPVSLEDVERTTMLVYSVPRPYGWMQSLDLRIDRPVLPRAVVGVEVGRIGSADCWWVTGVRPEGSGEAAASLARGALTVVQGPPAGSARVDLITMDGTSTQPTRITTSAETARVVFREFHAPGYVIVIWRGTDGWATTATGQTVRLQPLKAW